MRNFLQTFAIFKEWRYQNMEGIMINKNLCRVKYIDVDVYRPRDRGYLNINKASLDMREAYKYIYKQSNSIVILEVR